MTDAVLEHGGGRWDVPPARLAWTSGHATERDRIVAELAAGCTGAWGLKDPRTLLTLPFWLEGIGDAVMVDTFRHPAQVARRHRSRRTHGPVGQVECGKRILPSVIGALREKKPGVEAPGQMDTRRRG